MGDRRMISKKILATNQFLGLYDKTKVLYFMMILNADDDGFVSDVKGIMNHYNARPMHLRQLIESNYIITFKSGVALITHWRVHNLVRGDRYRETDWVEEKRQIYTDEKNCYHLLSDIPMVDKTHPQVVSISKDKLSQVSEDVRPLRDDKTEAPSEPKKKKADAVSDDPHEKILHRIHGALGKGVVFLTGRQIDSLLEKIGLAGFECYVERLADYILKKDAHVKNHYETILKWYFQDTGMNEANSVCSQKGGYDD